MQELSRQLNQTADEMQKAQAASRTNSGEAIAQNERALDRLRQAQERLQQTSGSSGGQGNGQAGQSGQQQQISELRQRAAQAAARQREIAKDMENLSRRGGQNTQDENSKKTREQLAERKDTLADSVNSLQQDIEETARAMGSGQQRAARQLKDAADSLSRNRVADRIREGKQALNSGQQGGSRTDERALERSLNDVSERLQSAEQNARSANGTGAEEALDRTRQLADNLDSLRRRLDENANRRNGNQQNGQQQSQGQGKQQGQQSGQGQLQGQSGQQGSRGSQSKQQGGSPNGGPQSGEPGGRQRGGFDPSGQVGGDWGDNRQLPAELRERLREAQDLRREWGGTSTGAVRQLDEVIDRLKRLADGHMEGDAATAALLKADVVEPLRQLELELSKQVQQQGVKTNLRLRDEGAAPEKYRKAVEEYYRRLSGAKPKQ
jgi:chromosome segregation ATPase